MLGNVVTEQAGENLHPAVIPVALIILTLISSGVVAAHFHWPWFLLIIGIPMAVTALISWLFSSWKPLIALSTTYLFFMSVWFIGFIANAVHDWFGRDIAMGLGVNPRWSKGVVLLALWGLLVYGIDRLLGLCFAALPESDELVGHLPHHLRARSSSVSYRSWTDGG